jgi:hypothetical protein
MSREATRLTTQLRSDAAAPLCSRFNLLIGVRTRRPELGGRRGEPGNETGGTLTPLDLLESLVTSQIPLKIFDE